MNQFSNAGQIMEFSMEKSASQGSDPNTLAKGRKP